MLQIMNEIHAAQEAQKAAQQQAQA
jgi:hypothetical protein